MYDEISVYPKTESGFAFKPPLNIVYLEALNNQTFNQDGNESAILKILWYNPPDLIFQNLRVIEKVKNILVNRVRNGYILDTLTGVDIQEIVKIRGEVIEIYEGVTYQENFKMSPFRKVFEKLVALKQKYKDEGNDLMQSLVKLIMNILFYGVELQKDIIEFHESKFQNWMEKRKRW